MTPRECQELMDAYVQWLREGLAVEAIDGACELTTPFLDRHNDHLQIYAVKRNGKIELSDDGYILADLRTSGLDLKTPKRKEAVDTILAGFGVRMEGGRLTTEASQRNLGHRIHTLVQAMLAVNDMFVMAQSRVASFFWEDVRTYLDDHDVRYSPRVKLSGRSGFDHAIDFLIPASRQKPERVVQAINSPTRQTVGMCLFSVGDVRSGRRAPLEAYAFLNDRDREVGGDVLEAFEAYEVKPTLWSRREDYAEALAG